MTITVFQTITEHTCWLSSYALHKIPWTMAQSLGLLCTVQKRLLWSRQLWLEGKHFCYKKNSVFFAPRSEDQGLKNVQSGGGSWSSGNYTLHLWHRENVELHQNKLQSTELIKLKHSVTLLISITLPLSNAWFICVGMNNMKLILHQQRWILQQDSRRYWSSFFWWLIFLCLRKLNFETLQEMKIWCHPFNLRYAWILTECLLQWLHLHI